MKNWVIIILVASAISSVQASDPNIAELTSRATAGDLHAQLELARAYEDGLGTPRNDQLAAKWYRAAADQGDAEAQSELGVMYLSGQGVEKDFTEAMKWLRKAAQQGSAVAMFNIATMYYNGNGVAVDEKTAYAWFLLADAAGNKQAADGVQRLTADLPAWKLQEAKMLAAAMLLVGKEVPAKKSQAVELYKKFGSDGIPSALVILGRLYTEGTVLPRDYSQAKQYCAQAADADYAPGMVCLAYLNASGALGPGHDEEAFSWYQKASKKGSGLGAYGMASMYAKGRGTAQNLPLAYMWLVVAANARIGVPNEPLRALEGKLGPKIAKKMAEKAGQQIAKTNYNDVRGDSLSFPFAIKFELP